MVVNSLLKRQFLLWGSLALLLVAWAAGGYAQRSQSDASWQYSQSISVRLSVRDKYGDLGSYKALFVVTDPDGERYKAEKDVSGKAWGDVYFPDDFSYEKPGKYSWKPSGRPGRYSWKGIVNGRTVASGRFEYKGFADQARILR